MKRLTGWTVAAACTIATVAGLSVSPASAQDVRNDRQDLRQDRQDVRQDTRDIRGDRQDIRQDTRDIRGDRRDIHNDWRAYRNDLRTGNFAAARAQRADIFRDSFHHETGTGDVVAGGSFSSQA